MITRSFTTGLATEFQAIFDFMPGAYLLLSPQLRVELVSLGYQAAVAAGWPSLAAGEYVPTVLAGAPVGQCLAGKLTASLAQVLATGQPHEVACHRTCQLPSQSRAGTSAAWQLSSQPVRDAAGTVCHVLCQVSLGPATATPMGQEELTAAAPANEASLGAMLAQLPVALCLLRGPRYVVEAFNPLAAQVWSQLATKALGHPFLELMPGTAVADYATACAGVWQSGRPVTWAEVPVTGLAEGEGVAGPTYFSLSFQAFQPQLGTQAGLLLIAQNVTQLLQARQQARLLHTELTATTAGLADYVAELLRASAHDG